MSCGAQFKSDFRPCSSWAVSLGSSICYFLYIFFLQAVDVTGCLPVFVLHRSDRNLLIDKRKNWKFWGWPQLAKFTHSLISSPGKCTLQLALAWNLPGTPEYRVFCIPSSLTRFSGELSALRCNICGFIKGSFGNLACILLQRWSLLEFWFLTMKNSGKITSASFDTLCRFCRSCKL